MVYPNPICDASTVRQCEGSPITLAENGVGNTEWLWWSNNSNIVFADETAQTTTATGASDGDIIYVTVKNQYGCEKTCEVKADLYPCTTPETAFAVRTMPEGEDNLDAVVDDKTLDVYSSCFRNDGFKRWGWTNFISESQKGGDDVVFSLYAAAGRCDLSKGLKAGTVTLKYDSEGNVKVTYEVFDGYLLSEAHVYIGCEPYPKTRKGEYTVAPGQFPYNGNIPEGFSDSTWSTSTLQRVSGDIYFIAHAVVNVVDIEDPEFQYISGISSDPVELFADPNILIDGDCFVNTDGWGKIDGEKVSFKAYPVPFENEVNISYKFEYETDVNINVYDTKGALIRTVDNTSYIKGTVGTTKIDLSRTDNQMYFVRLTTSKGTLVKKIISSSNLSRE